ncbi:deoxyribonuclease-1-like [Epinephelus moara]|uniref:deoxyribonuclease-1-like n=1 Tax=Epinephelus moara TaxID=300413 RepID=UPI00214E39DB|nr:deoxyribonuclease-1-like [Epinephelus moara]
MKIAAFNVKQLGWKKVNNPFVRENLIKIVSRYSVVVMLEVIDATGKAMDKFLGALNNHKDNVQHPYEMKCSEPLGRSSYREKFVFFYRKDQVTMINSYQYEEEEEEEEEEDYEHGEEYEDEEDDDDEYEDNEDEDDEEDEEDEDDTEDEAVDVLAREPFILQFKSPTTVVKKLALIPVHTKPEDTERELDAVDDVVKAVRKRWRTTNIMILGDFNADGRYLSKRKKKKIRISSPPYHWLIKDDVDTTTSNCNDNTYDRIVVFGQTMLKAVVPRSAKPFNFQRAFRLTDEQAQSISDHYPVEVELKPHTNATRRTSGTRGGSIRSRAHEETTSLFSVTPRISPAFLPSTQHIYHHPRLQTPAFIPRPPLLHPLSLHPSSLLASPFTP